MDKNNVLKRKDLIYPELSYKIVGVLYDVHSKLGGGYKEKYYQKALSVAFNNSKLLFKEQIYVELNFNGTKIGNYYLDFLIENKIVLEIKKDKMFSRKNIEQVYAYLKATSLKLGILAHFDKTGLKFKRILNIK